MNKFNPHNRFYLNPKDICPDTFKITAAEFRHLKVRRLKPGDIILGLDGAGSELKGEIIQLSDNYAVCRVVEKIHHQPPKHKISLGLGVIKMNALSSACEKAIELGAGEIFPLKTRYSARSIGEAEINRLRRLAVSAMKQSGRVFLPQIHEPTSLPELLDFWRNKGTILCADPDGESIFEFKVDSDVLALVGPEGGFSAEEMELLNSTGVKKVALSAYRLRSETAAAAAAGWLSMNLQNNT